MASIREGASKVIIAPGYGLAVAQAQHKLFEFVKLLTDAGVEVKFAIHPVAGRGQGKGYSGTNMVYGDAQKVMVAMIQAMKSLDGGH